MRSFCAWGLVAVMAAGCATQPPPPEAGASPPPGPATGTSAAAEPAPGGSSFLSVIGTPFLIAFKLPVCVLTIAIAAPIAGVSEISSNEGGSRDVRHQLSSGVDQNCGPPWVVGP